jgi:hypothetical protein
MTNNQPLTTKLLACALAAVITGAAHAEANYCIAVNGGFNGDGGGTSYIGKGFTVPAAGNCVPWSGFTKTASTVVLTTTGTGCLSSDGKVLTVSVSSADPDYLGALTPGSDYITLCMAGVTGCPVGDQDQGALGGGGNAAEQTCTAKLLKLPSSHA